VALLGLREVFPDGRVESLRSLCTSSSRDSIESGTESGVGGTMRRHSGCGEVDRSCKAVKVRRNSRPAQVFSSHIREPSLGGLDNRVVTG
jgi:hypothetical protein